MFSVIGLKWNSPDITWSVAKTNYPIIDRAFSSFFSPEFEALTKTAFATWARAANLNFTEIPDAPNQGNSAGIRVGFAKLLSDPLTIIGGGKTHALTGIAPQGQRMKSLWSISPLPGTHSK